MNAPYPSEEQPGPEVSNNSKQINKANLSVLAKIKTRTTQSELWISDHKETSVEPQC